MGRIAKLTYALFSQVGHGDVPSLRPDIDTR